MAPRQVPVAQAQPLQHGPQQAAVGARRVDVNIDHDLASPDGSDLAVVGWPEAAIRHLHDARLRIGGRDARLFLLLDLLLVGLAPPLPLGFQLGGSLKCPGDPLLELACCPLASRLEAPVAGVGIFVHFALQMLDQTSRLLQMLVQALLAAERRGSRAGPHPHPVLRQLDRINQSIGRQHGDMLRQKLVQKRAVPATEVGKAVIVHTHPATQPAIGVVALAQPLQRACAADPLARRIEPQSQQQPRARRRLTRRVLARPDLLVQHRRSSCST